MANHDLLTGSGEGTDTILVFDFGAQYAQVIARRVRDAKVRSELVPHTITADEVAKRKPIGIILSGGPKSVHVEGAPDLDPAIFELGIPVLGICYGQQIMAQTLGGRVAATDGPEYGRTDFSVTGTSELLEGLPTEQVVWMSHNDAVVDLPEGFVATGRTSVCPVAAMENADRKLYAVQWHPEVTHSQYGQDVISRFVELTGAEQVWTPANVIDAAVDAIREQVGDAKVLCGLSGGVDSAVAAALVHKAVGDQLTCVFVNHGLLRKGEAEAVQRAFGDHFDANLVTIDAVDTFMDALAGVTEPEQKRKIIGAQFIRTFEAAAREHAGDAKFLVQGTLYSDVVESGAGGSAVIKSHHNVGGLPDDMTFELCEPLRWLFKDEVRRVGLALGLPEEMVWRQPFPGPGLGVRIIGEVTRERCDLLREADAVVLRVLREAGLEREIWQSFAVLPADVRTVGVQGDARTYGNCIIVRAVTSEDAMTADFARIPFDVLEKISVSVINEVPGINRVAYDITSKPPGTIEWE